MNFKVKQSFPAVGSYDSFIGLLYAELFLKCLSSEQWSFSSLWPQSYRFNTECFLSIWNTRYSSFCLGAFVSFSLNQPFLFLASFLLLRKIKQKRKTNPIDQHMEVASDYCEMDDRRWINVEDGVKGGIWRGLLKCHKRRCMSLLFPLVSTF